MAAQNIDNNPGSAKSNIPLIFDDPNTEMVRWMQRQYPQFDQWDMEMMKHYPVVTDYECILHYLRGVAGPFIDFLTLIDIGCGVELVPTDFDSDEDGDDAKKVVEQQFRKMDLEGTMQRYAAYGEVLGRRATVRTYNAAGNGFYFNDNEKITGIDVVNPLTFDLQSVEMAVYDQTGKVPFIQNVYNPFVKLDRGKIELEQDRVDFNIRGTLMKHGPFGLSAMANCIQDLRTASAAPELRLELMYKQANVYSHTVLDVQELLLTPMGQAVLDDWELAEKKLQEQVDLVRSQQKARESMVTYSFMRPAQSVSQTSAGNGELATTEKDTYDVIALKMGIPLSLLYADAAKTVNRSSMETVLDGFVKRREASGGRKEYRTMLARYAQEIKGFEGILDGYFEIKFKPFLTGDIAEAISRMQQMAAIGATSGKSVISSTEIRRGMEMSDDIDFGSDESADYIFKPPGLVEEPEAPIANPNPHLAPENTVTQKQNLLEVKKALRDLGMFG